MLARVHVLCHDVIVCPVQQDLAQQFDRLPLRDVTVGLDQSVVVLFEETLEIRLQVSCDQCLVPRKDFLSFVSLGSSLFATNVP